MPSSPKKTAKTGSALLGQELRRLRGGRTLREIAQLTKTPPLLHHVGSLSEAGLCEIESGKTMPTLQTMHALSVVYKTSMSQLVAYVQEERLASGDVGPVTESAFQEHFRSGRWVDALRVALHAEFTEEAEPRRLSWRANRAACLIQLGAQNDALALLAECVERPQLPPRQLAYILYTITCCHVSMGSLRMAALVSADALSVATALEPEDPALSSTIEIQRASILIARKQFHLDEDERPVREALRNLENADGRVQHADVAVRFAVAAYRAEAHACLGNHLVAARDARRLASEAGVAGNKRWEGRANCILGASELAQGHRDVATRHLESALAIAEADRNFDLVFETAFRLFLLHSESRPGRATQMLRRCHAVHPYVTQRTPLTEQYVRVVRERS